MHLILLHYDFCLLFTTPIICVIRATTVPPVMSDNCSCEGKQREAESSVCCVFVCALLRGCGTTTKDCREAVVQPPLTPIRLKAKNPLQKLTYKYTHTFYLPAVLLDTESLLVWDVLILEVKLVFGTFSEAQMLSSGCAYHSSPVLLDTGFITSLRYCNCGCKSITNCRWLYSDRMYSQLCYSITFF